MDCYLKKGFIFKCFCIWIVMVFSFFTECLAFEINEEGRVLIQEAIQRYNTHMPDRQSVSDPEIVNYAGQIIQKLVPKGKQPPEGVNLRTTVIESSRPELHAYIDGHVVITTGLLFAMDNEAQLAGVLSHEIANLVEGYYINMYREIKAAKKRQRRKTIAGALFGSLNDVAVDYAVELEEIRETDRVF